LEPVQLGLTENSSEDLQISSKMSKSKPMGGIFIHDDDKTIEMKIKKSFCPIGVSENNPIMEIIRYIIFHNYKEFTIERPSKYGGTISYSNYVDLKQDFEKQNVHPHDVKQATSKYLCKIIEPIREHFKDREPVF
jgi:tyrosyl-tRNA synthetase